MHEIDLFIEYQLRKDANVRDNLTIDAITGHALSPHDRTRPSFSSTGFASWRSLLGLLRDAGYVKDDEDVTHITIDIESKGLRLHFKRKTRAPK